jgi:hypothetical protein
MALPRLSRRQAPLTVRNWRVILGPHLIGLHASDGSAPEWRGIQIYL